MYTVAESNCDLRGVTFFRGGPGVGYMGLSSNQCFRAVKITSIYLYN